MSKARTLAGVVSTGAVLADGTVNASEITGTLPAPNTPIGTDLTSADYSMTLPTAISAAAFAPVMSTFALDSNRELMLIARDLSLQAVVWDNSTKTFGTVVLLRSGTFFAPRNFAAVVLSSSSVLVSSLPTGTALETVVLSISGSTITVNTPVATTLAASSNLILANTRFVTCGSSYILNYTESAQPRFRAITVSGTTPTVGSELAYTGPASGNSRSDNIHSYALSSTSFISLSNDNTTVYAYPVSVSGTTLTGGTAATVTVSAGSFVTGLLSTNNVAIAYPTSGSVVACGVVSVSSNTASISTAATTLTGGSAPMMQVFGSRAFILAGTNVGSQISVITDTAGVATVGTPLTVSGTTRMVGFLSTEKVLLGVVSGNGDYYQYGISSGAAVLEKTFPLLFSNTFATPPGAIGSYTQPLSGPPSSNESKPISVRTSSGKVSLPAVGTSVLFTASFDGTNIAKVQQLTYTGGSVVYNDALSAAVAWAVIPIVIANGTNLQIRRIELT